jgi:hypothetical protein
MAKHSTSPRALIALLGLLPVVAGCHHGYDSPSPDGAAALVAPAIPRTPPPVVFDAYKRPLVPLAIGNTWHYTITSSTQFATPRGPLPFEVITSPWVAQIQGTQQSGNHLYFTQVEFNPGIRGVIPANQFLVRQDASGFFELDTVHPLVTADESGSAAEPPTVPVPRSIRDPAERAAFDRAAREIAARMQAVRFAFGWGGGGAEVGESSMLLYPLRVGATWAVLREPLFTRRVTALERLTTPAGAFTAWRLQLHGELFGPRDGAVAWYSASGLVRLSAHFEGIAFNGGQAVGRVITDTDQVLDDVQFGARAVASSDR